MNKWQAEWQYVEKQFKESGLDSFGGKYTGSCTFRSRYQHTKRVYKWLHEILEDNDEVDVEAMELAIIFHDVGYTKGDNKLHPFNSKDMFLEYANDKEWDEELINKVAYFIENHSNKYLMEKEDTPKELIYIMESDVMDEEGAMRIAWDCMAYGIQDAKCFEGALEHTKKFWDPAYNPMITPKAKKIFEEKQALVKEYVSQLTHDLAI